MDILKMNLHQRSKEIDHGTLRSQRNQTIAAMNLMNFDYKYKLNLYGMDSLSDYMSLSKVLINIINPKIRVNIIMNHFIYITKII